MAETIIALRTRTAVNQARSAQNGSQTKINASTRNHEAAVLTAAAFILIVTISDVLSGRTATNWGIDRSADQKSGFENALPTGKARTIGMARVVTRIRRVLAASVRAFQESGTTTKPSSPAVKSGNTNPERRHSNHN
jgi:hypothetical protein